MHRCFQFCQICVLWLILFMSCFGTPFLYWEHKNKIPGEVDAKVKCETWKYYEENLEEYFCDLSIEKEFQNKT